MEIKLLGTLQILYTASELPVFHSNITSIRNEKIVWKHGPHFWYFCLKLKYLGWLYRGYIKTAKDPGLYDELISENNFEAVLATFCCYDDGANASEAVQKIATDQKHYHKCPFCIQLFSMLNSQNISINSNEKRLLTYLLGHLRRSYKSCRRYTEKEARTSPWSISSIMEVR